MNNIHIVCHVSQPSIGGHLEILGAFRNWHPSAFIVSQRRLPVIYSEKVAVVGAGPAGLTCAYFLSQKGYKVTVFESQKVGGGMLGIAVPEFRLPREIIEDEIKYIESCGI